MSALNSDFYEIFNFGQVLTSKHQLGLSLQASIWLREYLEKFFLKSNLPGGKGMTKSILDVDDVEGFSADLLQVTTTGGHAQVARFKLDEVHNFVGGDVELNSVVNFHQRIGVTDGAAVMGCNEEIAICTNLDS